MEVAHSSHPRRQPEFLPKVNTMKRNSDRYRKFAASPDDEISDETSTTRLYSYDLAEVKAMCVDG
jgi:hypothetical protein